MIKTLFTLSLSSITFLSYSQVQKWEDWQSNFIISNGTAISSPTSRNFGLNLWSDRGFGAELHYLNNRFGTAIYTRSSGEAIWLGNYNANATQQQSFNAWMTLVNGNVGIGNLTPAYSLDVNGTGQFAGGAKIGNGPIGFFGDGVNHAVRAFNTTNTGGFWVQSYNGVNTYMYVGQTGANTGNVGIGTIYPTNKLQLGDFATSNTNAIVIPGVYNFEQLKIGQYGNGGTALELVNHVDLGNSYGIKFSANSGDVAGAGLQIKYAPWVTSYNALSYTTGIFMGLNGNVGIGTTDTKGYKLAVAGSAGIVAEKVVVKQLTNWPDYVFDNSYKLPSLSSVETFIKKYNHLPEVPSAKEVEAEGVDLAQSQKIMLKKLEELTLYMIEQDKENQQLKQRVKQLENNQWKK